MLAIGSRFFDSIIEFLAIAFEKPRKPRVIATHYEDGHLYRFEALDHTGKDCVGTVRAPSPYVAWYRVAGYEYALFPTDLKLEKPMEPVRQITRETDGERFQFEGFDSRGEEKFGTIRASSPLQAAQLLRTKYYLFPSKVERTK